MPSAVAFKSFSLFFYSSPAIFQLSSIKTGIIPVLVTAPPQCRQSDRSDLPESHQVGTQKRRFIDRHCDRHRPTYLAIADEAGLAGHQVAIVGHIVAQDQRN